VDTAGAGRAGGTLRAEIASPGVIMSNAAGRPIARVAVWPAAVLAALAMGGWRAGPAAAVRASSATLTVDEGCYVLVGSPSMRYTGSGFTPHAQVVITSRDGTVDTSVRADRHGAVSGTTNAPTPDFSAPGSKTVPVTAQDGQHSATVAVHVAVFGWQHGSVPRAHGLRALTERTAWSFSGFIPDRPIFGHYLWRGRQVARARFGTATGPCGVLTARARLFPAAPHHRRYTVQYDDNRAYSARSVPRIVGAVGLSG
jgi:hypothetical protein